MLSDDLTVWLARRNAVLTHPSAEGARVMLAESGVFPATDAIALAAVHKARLGWTEATSDMVAESKDWLIRHGYMPALMGTRS